jgi:hypothetical protein
MFTPPIQEIYSAKIVVKILRQHHDGGILPEIVKEAPQNLFTTPPALQPPLLPCPDQSIDNRYLVTITDAVTPSLPSAPRSKDATSNVTTGHPQSNFVTKIGANDVRRTTNFDTLEPIEDLDLPSEETASTPQTTPTISRFRIEITPNFAFIDASTGSSDGTFSVTKHGANSTNETPAKATTHNNKLILQGNDIYNTAATKDALITNIEALRVKAT